MDQFPFPFNNQPSKYYHTLRSTKFIVVPIATMFFTDQAQSIVIALKAVLKSILVLITVIAVVAELTKRDV